MARDVLKHTSHTYTPVNVPRPACSSRWRDSAAFSSLTAEEPFLREGQDGKAGVVKVNELYKMELWKKELESPPAGLTGRRWGGKKKKKKKEGCMKGVRQPWATPYCCCLDTIHRKKDRLLWLIGHFEGAHTPTHGDRHTRTNSVPIWPSLPLLQRGLKSLAQIYSHLLRFSHRQVNVENKEINVLQDLTSFACIESSYSNNLALFCRTLHFFRDRSNLWDFTASGVKKNIALVNIYNCNTVRH